MTMLRRGAVPGWAGAVAGLALVTACASGPAPEPPGPLPGGPSFAAVDADADDHIAEPEWENHGERTFIRLDADESGELSPAELNSGFDAFDLNGDGILSSHEVDAAAFDVNEDGVLSREEWALANAHGRVDVNGDGKVDRDEFRARRAGNFQSYDRDLDRRVSRVELASDAPRFTLFRF
ncbi:MAG: EF-hand domain-containing protein [Pseudomonadota bacterium]